MRIMFSKIEIRDLLKAWLLASLAFAIATVGLSVNLIVAVPIALITAGVGILLHELMHKFTAARFGYHTEFRANNMGLIIGLVTSLFGFLLIAPGAVFFGGSVIDYRKSGIISLAGPVTNIVLALIALPILMSVSSFPVLASIAMFAYRINAWLGLFNMLPFMGLDGEKVLAWKPSVFWLTIIVAVAMVFWGYYW